MRKNLKKKKETRQNKIMVKKRKIGMETRMAREIEKKYQGMKDMERSKEKRQAQDFCAGESGLRCLSQQCCCTNTGENVKQYVKVQRRTNTNIGCVHTYAHVSKHIYTPSTL